MRWARGWELQSAANSLQPLPDPICFQRSTVADEELGCPKVQELLHAGPDLTEVVGVVRVAGLAGSKHAAEPAAHQQVADDGLAAAQQNRDRTGRVARREDDFPIDAEPLQRHLVRQEDVGPDGREFVINEPVQELRRQDVGLVA